VKLSSWPEIGSDGDVLLTPYVPKGITGYDDDDDTVEIFMHFITCLSYDTAEFQHCINTALYQTNTY
jgi:hypothetical protein